MDLLMVLIRCCNDLNLNVLQFLHHKHKAVNNMNILQYYDFGEFIRRNQLISELTFPSWETMNKVFEPPSICTGRSILKAVCKVGTFTFEPAIPPSCPRSFKPHTYT